MNANFQCGRPRNPMTITTAANPVPRQQIERLRSKLIRETETYLNNPNARPWAKRRTTS